MVTATEPRTFTSPEVCNLARISYRQLDYWCARGYLEPDRRSQHHWGSYHRDRPHEGPGYPRTWTEAETIRVCALADMLRAGISWPKAAELIKANQTATICAAPLPESLPTPTTR